MRICRWRSPASCDVRHLGDTDENHLQRATAEGRVLCTFDTDFIELAAAGQSHAGIVLGQQEVHYIGAWVNYLELMQAAMTPEEMIDRVEYL
jgi:hypothetical protein